MKQKTRTPRFDIPLEQRLMQSKVTSMSFRLKKQGYKMYRVYEIHDRMAFEQKKIKYGKLTMIIDYYLAKHHPSYEIRWLKEKHLTALRIKGHDVMLAEPGDSTTKVGL